MLNDCVFSLKQCGILSLKALVMNTKRDLVNVNGISEAKVEAYVKKATEILSRSESTKLFSSEFILGTAVL